jgi:hypothetical protein
LSKNHKINILKTLIVPVDFSNSSLNAVIYTGELAKNRNFDQILLIGNFHLSVLEQVLPSPDMIQENSEIIYARRKLVEDHLAGLIEKLKYDNLGHTIVRSIITENLLIDSIPEIIASVKPELVVIGSRALESNDDNFVADQLIALIEAISTPIMIVPALFKYSPINTAIVAGNFRSFKNADLLARLKVIISADTPRLLLLNVNNDKSHESVADITNDYFKESLSSILPGYNYQINSVANHALIQGIFDFASRNRTELIIALPEHHSLFYRLLHTSVLHKIHTFTYIPVLILK